MRRPSLHDILHQVENRSSGLLIDLLQQHGHSRRMHGLPILEPTARQLIEQGRRSVWRHRPFPAKTPRTRQRRPA